MSKRGDNIHKRKDGRWEGRYKKGRTLSGAIQYGSVYGKSYREVKEKLSLVSSSPTKPTVIKGRERTFGEVLNLWMSNNKVRLKGGTINKYQNLIDTHIMPELGSISISSIDATIINEFLNRKLTSGRVDGSGGLSPSYVRSIMLVVSAAIHYAVEEQMCQPLKSSISKPTVLKQDLPILDQEEQKTLEEYTLNNFNFTCVGILISLYTGLRIGEICALAWEDVDFKRMIIRVRHTVARVKTEGTDAPHATQLIIDTPKTKASIRDIPISSSLLPILTRLRSISGTGYVISDCETFVRPRTFEYRYHRVLDAAGITQVNFHALRHTFATRCIEAGVDVKSLSEILGHANVSVTLNTYVHSSIEMKRNQLEKLPALSA